MRSADLLSLTQRDHDSLGADVDFEARFSSKNSSTPSVLRPASLRNAFPAKNIASDRDPRRSFLSLLIAM